MGKPFAKSTSRHFVPFAVLFFPIVERLSINLVNRRLCDIHLTRLSGQEEIDVVSLSIRRFHVHTSEVFAGTEIGQPIVVYSYQVESEVLPLVLNVKLRVTVFFAFGLDVFLDAGGNIRLADLFFLPAFFRMLCGFLWMLRMLCGRD